MKTRTALVALALSGTALGGCLGLIAPQANAPKPVVTIKQLEERPGTRPATTEVAVYKGPGDLPRGFFFAQSGGKMKLYAAPAYPSPDQAHAVIAGMAAAPPAGSAGYLRPDDVEAAFVAKAKELGANGLFIASGRNVGYAIHVSQAAVVERTADPDALLAKAARGQPGFRPHGKLARHDMAAADPITFEADKGACYLLAFALDTDALLAPKAEAGILLESHSGDELMSNRTSMLFEDIAEVDGFSLRAPSNGRYLHLRSGVLPLGCAWNGGAVSVTVRGSGRSPLGEGHYVTRVYRKKVSRAELQRKKAEHDRAVAQAEADAERYRREEEARRQREAEQRQRDEERRQREAERASTARTSGGGGGGGTSSYYSFSLKNECGQTVKLKVTSSTGNPKFSGGTETTIGSNTIRSFSGTGPTYFWILDGSGNGISSFTASSGQRDMRILQGCTGFAPR